jgi:hypothetical protein
VKAMLPHSPSRDLLRSVQLSGFDYDVVGFTKIAYPGLLVAFGVYINEE